jgi:hypothetical protein
VTQLPKKKLGVEIMGKFIVKRILTAIPTLFGSMLG